MKYCYQILVFLLTFIYAKEAGAQPHYGKPVNKNHMWRPIPRVVETNENGSPSDAIVLYDGADLGHWVSSKEGQDILWKNEKGILTIVPGTGHIQTKQVFGDCQIHVEWRIPGDITGEGQDRGNSGIRIQSRYEVQILESYQNQNRTYVNGQAGAVYGRSIPLVNASRKPGEWQEYDIIFTAPRYNNEGILMSSGRVTVLHNGVLIQHNADMGGRNAAHGKAPLTIQDHGAAISFRNIWIRPLNYQTF